MQLPLEPRKVYAALHRCSKTRRGFEIHLNVLVEFPFKQNSTQLVFLLYMSVSTPVGQWSNRIMWCDVHVQYWIPLDREKIYLLNKKKWHKFVIEILLLLIFCLFVQPWYEVRQHYTVNTTVVLYEIDLIYLSHTYIKYLYCVYIALHLHYTCCSIFFFFPTG